MRLDPQARPPGLHASTAERTGVGSKRPPAHLIRAHSHTSQPAVSHLPSSGPAGRPLELDDILDLVEERYMFDPDDPYDEKSDSSDDQVPEADLAELSTALASGSLGS